MQRKCSHLCTNSDFDRVVPLIQCPKRRVLGPNLLQTVVGVLLTLAPNFCLELHIWKIF